jgi:Icc-related predicted phosphoesterase
VAAELGRGGVRVLERANTSMRVAGQGVGIVGVKGFVGGFADSSHIPDFGEPAMRDLYRETGAEVAALDRGLREVALCPIRIVLMHYSPTPDTLAGEPPGIWAFLGTDRLAAPIVEHEPDLVVHGHAHAGSFRGAIAAVPVFNVSLPVIQGAYELFQLRGKERASTTIR